MVSVLASSVVDHGFESKTTSLVVVASLLSMLNQGLRTKTGWLQSTQTFFGLSVMGLAKPAFLSVLQKFCRTYKICQFKPEKKINHICLSIVLKPFPSLLPLGGERLVESPFIIRSFGFNGRFFGRRWSFTWYCSRNKSYRPHRGLFKILELV